MVIDLRYCLIFIIINIHVRLYVCTSEKHVTKCLVAGVRVDTLEAPRKSRRSHTSWVRVSVNGLLPQYGEHSFRFARIKYFLDVHIPSLDNAPSTTLQLAVLMVYKSVIWDQRVQLFKVNTSMGTYSSIQIAHVSCIDYGCIAAPDYNHNTHVHYMIHMHK